MLFLTISACTEYPPNNGPDPVDTTDNSEVEIQAGCVGTGWPDERGLHQAGSSGRSHVIFLLLIFVWPRPHVI